MKRFRKVLAFVVALTFVLSCFTSVSTVYAAERKAKKEEKQYEQEWKEDQKNAVKKEVKEKELVASDSPIFRHIDKTAFDEKKHTKRFENEEKLNTYVFGNDDGSKTVYYMHENVKYKDKEGKIKDKDISLVKKNKGYGIAQNEVELFLPENPKEGIDVEYSGHIVTIIPQGNNDTAVAKQDADAVVYEKYFDENSSLKYTPLLSGVKEDIILADYAEDVAYDFVIETNGLFVYNDDKGYYLAENAEAEPLFYLGDVEVYDAIGKPCMGTMEVSELEAGKKYKLTLSVDDAFLADPTTVYPVTIDPTLTISDTVTGADSIIDAPIFEGLKTRNFGKYKYNTVGTTTASYGVGRTVVKLPGLLNSAEYKNVTSDQIESVKFYVRDSSGTGSQTIYLYQLSNSSWTETSVTWSNVGSYYPVGTSATMSSGKVTAFDISSLVWAWKNNKFNPNAGFIMMNQTETNNKSFCSSEYSTTSYRPYVVMTYAEDVPEEATEITLDKSSVSIREGTTLQLKATTDISGTSVTWTSTNSTVATVSSTGLVTGKKAGVTTILAMLPNGTRVACTVYVAVADGVYYIQNMNSGHYLNVKNGYIDSETDVIQSSKLSGALPITTRLREMWKIYYIGNGKYTVRPMHKLNMGLDVTSGNVDIWDISTSDSSAVATYGQWSIEWDSTGYVFKNKGESSLTMQVQGASTASGTTVIATTYSSNSNSRWTLSKITSPPSGVMWYDTYTNAVVSLPTMHVEVSKTKSLSAAKLYAIMYSGKTISQTFSWTSADTSIATVNSSTGAVTGKSVGKTTVTGKINCNGTVKTVSFNVCVGYPDLFNTLIDSRTLSATYLDNTDDGFFIMTTSLARILASKGIVQLPKDIGGTAFNNVYNFFDDWYIFGIESDGVEKYGLCKMREQEYDKPDGGDGDAPGVTISFVGLNVNKLNTCLNERTMENKYNLYQHLKEVVENVLPNSVNSHDVDIVNYFADVKSDAPYLIAEKFINVIAQTTKDGCISLSDIYEENLEEIKEIEQELKEIQPYLVQYADLVLKKNQLIRIPNALKRINERAGYSIYDEETGCIWIENKSQLSEDEKYAILVAFAGTETFNSFAAEVEFHADAINGLLGDIEKWYSHAVRADMSLDNDYDYSFFERYYDLESSLVQAQAKEHGGY